MENLFIFQSYPLVFFSFFSPTPLSNSTRRTTRLQILFFTLRLFGETELLVVRLFESPTLFANRRTYKAITLKRWKVFGKQATDGKIFKC